MKKLALYFVSFCSFFFVGCSDSSPTPTQLTVMFNTNGGSAVEQQSVEENKKATKPADPTKDLYTFEGWYSDEALTTSFDFETPITANTTLYAKWTEAFFDVTYKSDANTELGTEKVSQVTPKITRNSTNSFLVEGKYAFKFFTDEAQTIAFDLSKDLTASVTLYVAFKDIVTPANRAVLITEIDNAITEQGKSADLNYINTEKITDMKELFRGRNPAGGSDNVPITNRIEFSGDISLWNVSAVTSMNGMFLNAINFNGDISKWNVGAVEDMGQMFSGADVFNGDISAWNVGAVTDMSFMFAGADVFNGDISAWNVGAVEDMAEMFRLATAFNSDISSWDVSAVNSMNSMFQDASAFNQDISSWEVGKVNGMGSMFGGASVFNRDISDWDVSAVISMNAMFSGASAFNQDISSWEVSALINTGGMFQNATAFDQDLEAWSTYLPLDDNDKFNSSDFFFNKTDMFKDSPREDNPPSWY